MGEGLESQLISPSEINVEPRTVIKAEGLDSRLVGGQYSNPSLNSEGVHLINVDSLNEGSKTLEVFGKMEIKFKEEADNQDFLPMLTSEEKRKVSERIGEINHKLISDLAYKQDFERLLKVHEMAHRTQEVRLKYNENFSKQSHILAAMPEGNQSNIIWDEYYKTAALIKVYDEADAIVSGLSGSVDIDDQIKSDSLFMSSVVTWSKYGEKNKDGSQAKLIFSASMEGVIPAYMPIYELATLTVQSGDTQIPLKLKNGQMLYSELKDGINQSVRRSLLMPESIINDINKDNQLNKSIDSTLMSVNEEHQNVVDRAGKLSVSS